MLKKTLLATTAISAALFAAAAALPAITDSRGGDTASPPAASSQTLVQAPAQDIRQQSDGGRLAQPQWGGRPEPLELRPVGVS